MGIFGRNKSSQPLVIDAKIQGLGQKAQLSLDKFNIGNQRAAVSLIVDYSISMENFYRDGSVQRLAEQTLGLGTRLDDDGKIPVYMFHDQVEKPFVVAVNDYDGVVDDKRRKFRMGGTRYAPAMHKAVADYQDSGATDPALMVFQTDGAPGDRMETERALVQYSHLPIFWAFVGFGYSITFLEKLDELPGRVVDNASFFHAQYPLQTSDEALYDGLTKEFSGWVNTARSMGILR